MLGALRKRAAVMTCAIKLGPGNTHVSPRRKVACKPGGFLRCGAKVALMQRKSRCTRLNQVTKSAELPNACWVRASSGDAQILEMFNQEMLARINL